MQEIIHPGALETKSQLDDDLGEIKSQLAKQSARIRELRVKKADQPGKASRTGKCSCSISPSGFPDAFYGDDDADLPNIDVMTDVSMAPTTFTRYTAAPSTASKKSRWVAVARWTIEGGT